MAIPKGTKIPSSGGFLKIGEGEISFRMLTDFFIAYQGWKDSKSMVRKPLADGSASFTPDEVDIDTKFNKGPRIDYVWIAKALDLNDGQVKLLTLSQKTIMKAIEAWETNPRGGDIKKYDCSIIGKKDGGKTTYTFQAFAQGEIEKSWKDNIKKADLSFVDVFEGGAVDQVYDAMSSDPTKD